MPEKPGSDMGNGGESGEEPVVRGPWRGARGELYSLTRKMKAKILK